MVSSKKSSTTPIVDFPLSENLRKFRKFIDIGQEEMAAQVGVHHQTYSRYERGEIIPGVDFLARIISIFNANPIFLITGKGEFFMKSIIPTDSDSGANGKIANARKSEDGAAGEEGQSLLVKYAKDADWVKDTRMANVLLEVLMPWIEMNFGSSAIRGLVEGWIMNSDNMEPSIHSGDLVLIDTSFTRVNGSGIYAFNDGRKTLIRRIYERLDGAIDLCSDNPKYKNDNTEIPLDQFHESLLAKGQQQPGLLMVGKVIRVLSGV